MATTAPNATVDATAVDATTGFARGLDQRVTEWVRSVLGDVALTFGPPTPAAAAARSVGLYLMALAPTTSTRGANAPPLQFSVRYLVTTSGPDAAESHGDLFSLAFAAMERPEFDTEFEPLPIAGWSAFGSPPQPAFAIRLPLRKVRAVTAAPPVRQPLVLAPAGLLALQGTVLGPGDVALANARVEVAGTGLSAMTDHQGRFRFGGVPADRPLGLRVLARGTVHEFQTDAVGDLRGPLQLRMSLA